MRRFIAVVLIALITGEVLAAPKRVIHHNGVSRDLKSPPLRFDPKTYAASIAGVDCSNAADRAAKIIPIEKAFRVFAASAQYWPPLKDQFETTDSYNQRIRRIVTDALGEQDRIIAVIPLSEMIKYNADNHQMMVTPEDSRLSPKLINVKVYSEIVDQGHYSGINAYGATADVTRETFTQFWMSIPVASADTLKMNLNMSAESAKALHDNGSLIVIGSLIGPPYAGVETAYEAATVNSPTATNYRKVYIGVVPECMIIANGGKELGRFGVTKQ